MNFGFTSNLKTVIGSTVLSVLASSLMVASEPSAPAGIRGILNSELRCLTLVWSKVEADVNGQTLSGPVDYNIYRRESRFGEPVKINSSLIRVPVFADRVRDQIYYYSVRAVNSAGEESADSLLVDSSPDTNLIYISKCKTAILTIPGKSSSQLYPYGNEFSAPLEVALVEEPIADQPDAIRSLRFHLIRSDTKAEVPAQIFKEADVWVEIQYSVLNGQVIRGNPNAAHSSMVTSARPENLSVTWFNGVAWIKLGGEISATSQSLKINSRNLGRFRIQASEPASALTLDRANVYPGLFTPNGDGRNDRVYFVLENPNHSDIRGDIYDLSGRHVAVIPSSSLSSGPETTLEWNGMDLNGSPVGNGIYIYRLEGEGKVITGSVAVAR